MLIGLSGYLTGYNGTFPFNKPGDSYEDYPILGMRLFCVTLGTLIVPFCYVIVWCLSGSITSSVLASALILFGSLSLSCSFIRFTAFFCRRWHDYLVAVYLARSHYDVLHHWFHTWHGSIQGAF